MGKLIKSENQKKILKKPKHEKKLIEPTRILKKTDRFGSVRFRFHKPETEKSNQIELLKTRTKKTEPN
jgi:hypothetical protein